MNKPQVSKPVLRCVLLILLLEIVIGTACWQMRGLWRAVKAAEARYVAR